MTEATAPPKPPDHTEYNKVRMAHLYEMAAFRYRSAGDFAQLALKSVIIINGGALVAILAFVGAVERPLEGVGAVALWFVAGLIFGLLAVLGAYFTQSDYGLSEFSDADMIYFGHVGNRRLSQVQSDDADKSRDRGQRWEIFAIGYAMISLACFLGGGWCGLHLLG